MTFDILQHLDSLEPDGGANDPRGDHSFKCPVCGSNNFKVNVKTGHWSTFGCDCASTEAGKRKIRDAISPAKKPDSSIDTKPVRRKQRRSWDYYTAITLERNQPALTVHRTDDGNGERKIWQTSHCPPSGPKEVGAKVLPYGYAEAIEALDAGEAFVFWVEGEPCVDAFRKLGLVAVTSLGGCGNFQPDRDGGLFPSDRLVIVPDRDKAGLKYAKTVAETYAGCRWLYPFPGTAEWNGSCPEKGGLDIADWIEQGATVDHILKGIGQKLEPASEAESFDIRDEFLRDAESLKSRLDRGLSQIDQIPDVATRSVALHTLQQDLGLSQKAFTTLVTALSEAKGPQVSESFDDLMAEDDEETLALVDDLLPTGLVLVAAEGGAGKSTFAYQLAEAITNGTKFAGQFQCQQAPVLIIQKDESLKDAKTKWHTMGLKPARGSLTIKWQFSPMMFPELRRWIEETKAKAVVLDSLLTIAGGQQINPKDAEFGLLIYRLNQLAGELGITIICLHHVVKGGGDKKRTEIGKDDIYGTAYVYNGASDAWGLWRTTEDGTGDTLFSLRCLKARSGLVDIGTTYEFTGNDEDRRMWFKGIANRTISLNEIKSARQRVISYLQRANGAAFTSAQLSQNLKIDLVKYAAKLCADVYANRAVTGIDRKKLISTGGRPQYAYFHPSENSYTKVEKVKVPPSNPSFSTTSTAFPPSSEPAYQEPSAEENVVRERRVRERGEERDEEIQDFSAESVLTREGSPPQPELPDWAEPRPDYSDLPF